MEINQILPKIKHLQKSKNWSSLQLAKYSGVPQTTISSLFRRNNLPTLPTLQMMCSAFDISLSQFFNEYDSVEGLSPAQRELLRCWDDLSERQKNSIMELVKSITEPNINGGSTSAC